MDNEELTTEEQTPAQGIYRTGRTAPPKSRGGLIAFLLAAVIFLCGLSTALGLLNIRLFRQISDGTDLVPISFSREAGPRDRITETGQTRFSALGFTGQSLSSFYQVYYHLPRGIYITEVADGSQAQALGVEPGDVLIGFGGEAVSSEAVLEEMVRACLPGEVTELVLYRDGTRYTVQLHMD